MTHGDRNSIRSAAPAKKPPPLDLSDMEGTDLLSPAEVELCSVVRLLPTQYLQVKVMLALHSWRVLCTGG